MIIRLPIKIALYVGFGRVICVLGRQVRFSSKLSTFFDRGSSTPIDNFSSFSIKFAKALLISSNFGLSTSPERGTPKLTTNFCRGSRTPPMVDNLLSLKPSTFTDKKALYYQHFSLSKALKWKNFGFNIVFKKLSAFSCK